MRIAHVPGGRVVLGLDGDVREVLQRHAPPRSFARFDAQGVIEALATDPVQSGAYFSPKRTVTIGPLEVEVEATPFADCMNIDDEAVDVPLARAGRDGWRLPTPDEWEYLYGAGARTLFPWGDGWPRTPACRVDPDNFTNAFGLRFAFKTEVTSQRGVLGGGDPDGWNLNGFDGDIVHATSYFMHHTHVAHFEWEAYQAAGVRRVRSP
jgi:hypothetical protein